MEEQTIDIKKDEERDPSSVTDMKKFMKRAKLPYYPYDPEVDRTIRSGSFVIFVETETHKDVPYGTTKIKEKGVLGYIRSSYENISSDYTIPVEVPDQPPIFTPSRNLRVLNPKFVESFRDKQKEAAIKFAEGDEIKKRGQELAYSLEIIFPQNWDLKLVPLFGSKFKEYRYEGSIRFPECA